MSSSRVFLASCLAFACLIAAPLRAQQLGGGGGVDVSFWRVGFALIVCAAAAVALAFILRRSGKGEPIKFNFLGKFARPGRIRVIESRRIATQAELSIVQCNGEEFVILCGPSYARVVGRRELADVAEIADPEA